MQQRFLLQILLLAQHVSGTTMPIIRSSRVLYSGCCLWYLVLWFSSCWSGVELRVMCPVCRMLGRKAARNLYSRNTNKTGIQCICWLYSQGISFTLFCYSIFQTTFGIRLFIQNTTSFSRLKGLENIEGNYAIVDSRIMRKCEWLFVNGCEGKTTGFLQQSNFWTRNKMGQISRGIKV